MTLDILGMTPHIVEKRGNDGISEEGHQVACTRQHEGERVLLLSQVPEGLISVAEKMHHGSSQKHSPSKLGPQNQEPLVPFQNVGGNARDEGGDEDHDQAPHLRENQGPSTEVGGGVGVGVTVVVVAAVDGDGEGEE